MKKSMRVLGRAGLSVYEQAAEVAASKGLAPCSEYSYDPVNQVPFMVRLPGRKTPVRVEVTRASYAAKMASLRGSK